MAGHGVAGVGAGLKQALSLIPEGDAPTESATAVDSRDCRNKCEHMHWQSVNYVPDIGKDRQFTACR